MNYLKGLNTLRAIAALIVIWSHIEFIKSINNLPKIDFWIFPNAHFSVTLFFVLSGFLITFLLVKEQFYIFWPILVYLISKRLFAKTIISFIITYTALPFIINYINISAIRHENLYSFTEKFFYYIKFKCMAYGGLLGYCLVKNKKWISSLNKNFFLSLLIVVFPFIIWFSNIAFYRFTEGVYAIFFGLMILVVTTNKKINIDNPATNFLGKISYGIYMFHWIIILLTIKFLEQVKESEFYNLYLYSLVIIITLFISWASFNTIEKYFLNLKKKFEIH